MSNTTDSIRYFVFAFKRRRLKLGLTQQQVSDRSGISLPTVNQIEGLKRAEPDLRSLERLAYAVESNLALLISEGQKSMTHEFEDVRLCVGKKIKDLRESPWLHQARAGLTLWNIAHIYRQH